MIVASLVDVDDHELFQELDPSLREELPRLSVLEAQIGMELAFDFVVESSVLCLGDFVLAMDITIKFQKMFPGEFSRDRCICPFDSCGRVRRGCAHADFIKLPLCLRGLYSLSKQTLPNAFTGCSLDGSRSRR